jgi:tetratricopeptide (TPR) repeat protein
MSFEGRLSKCVGAGRTLLCAARGCVACLVVALLLGAGAARAQSNAPARPSAAGSRAPAGTEQQRARRVSAAGSSSNVDAAGARVESEAGRAASKTKEATGEDGDEPPPVAVEEGGSERLSKLRAQLKEAKNEGERTRLRRTLVDYLVALDRKGEAIQELRAGLKEERFDPVGFYNLGNALARLDDTDTAIDAYRKAIEQRHGHYARALNNLGVLLLRQGRWDEAQEALTSALRQEAGRYPEASYNLGRLYSLRGEADLAIREWTRVLALQPDHADAALALARALAEDGNPQRALSVLDSFTARRGASEELTEARHEILSNAGPEVSSDTVTTTASTNPAATSRPAIASSGERAAASSNLAKESASLTASSRDEANSRAASSKMKTTDDGQRPLAASSLRSLTVDRETYDLLERAREAREAGKEQESLGLYNRVLARRNGFFPPANLELSFVLAALNRREEAIASLEKLIAREGARYPIAYFHLGRQYEILGQLDRAAAAYSRAASAYGEREPQFLLDVSRVREKEGNIAAALEAMEEYARISERHGHTPEWTAERLAQLRQKNAPAPAPPQTPAPK